MKEINSEMLDILEIDSISDNDILEEFDMWDSLARLTLLAFIDKHYDINLFEDDIKDVKTIRDIKEIVKAKQK